MKRFLYVAQLALVAAIVALPALAYACPQCAGRSEAGGIMRGVLLGGFIFFPFAVVAAVVRVIKQQARREALPAKLGS